MMNASKRLYTLAEMQEFNVARILELVRKLSLIDGFRFLNGNVGLGNPVKADYEIDFGKLNVEPFLANLHELGVFLLESELVTSKGYVDRIEALMKRPTFLSSFVTEYDKLHSTIHVEIGQKYFFRLSESEKALFQPTKDRPIYGSEVRENFSSAADEIDEAAKCLALGRSTACVFHLMRAMEITLLAVRKCLALPESTEPRERNWGMILQSLRDEVKRRKKLQSSGWKNLADQHFFPDLLGSMTAVKEAWRDPTMHVEKRYLPDEANEIFWTVRTLMQKIASRMNQGGLPLA